MHCVKKVTDDLYWIGGSDRRLALFENVYPIPRGVSYNSYVLLDEKTVLLDTVDASISGLFLIPWTGQAAVYSLRTLLLFWMAENWITLLSTIWNRITARSSEMW